MTPKTMEDYGIVKVSAARQLAFLMPAYALLAFLLWLLHASFVVGLLVMLTMVYNGVINWCFGRYEGEFDCYQKLRPPETSPTPQTIQN